MDAKTMSDNSRRTVCRLAFLLLCALPFSLVIYQILHPFSSSQWQQAIKANLGVTTKIGSVETPLPFVTVFHDVKFSDPELEHLHLKKVKIVSGTTNEVFIEHPVQVNASALATLSNRLRESLMRTDAASNAWNINLNQATISRSDGESAEYLELASVGISVFPYPEHTTAHVVANPAVSPNDPLKLTIRHERNNEGPQEHFAIDTGTAYLPCWLMRDFWDESKTLGRACQFAGFVEFEKVNKSWNCKVLPSSCFHGMDLQSLTIPFGKNVTGLAHSTINQCEIVDGRIVSLDLDLQCEDVTIDPATVKSAEQYLDAQWLTNDPTPSSSMLELRFQFADGRMSITTPDTVAAGHQPLVQFRHFGSLPIGDLAAFLEGGSNVNTRSIGFLNYFDAPPEQFADRPSNQAPADYR